MVLLDTCALLWSVNGDPLAPRAGAAISGAARAGSLYISPVSAWEIGLLASRGRLVLPVSPGELVARVLARPGVRVAALTPEIAAVASYLPGNLHRDPADRMLVSTALAMGLQLITRDERLLEYGAQGHVRTLAC